MFALIDPVDVVLEFAIHRVHATLPGCSLYLPRGHAAHVGELVVECMPMNSYPALHMQLAPLSCICSWWPELAGHAVQAAEPFVVL